MEKQIKLYKHFVEKIGELGQIKRAWFTTFNLDISFFEKYILSAILGKEFNEVKTALDYEALNENLANDIDEIPEDKVDVRVFYDYRMLKLEGGAKQTTVHLHPINTSRLKKSKSGSFEKGVFHPKVCLFQTRKDELWLMCSSANLTFGGWARNRESFFLEKINNNKNAREVGAFFSDLTNSIKEFKEDLLLKKLNNGRFGSKETNWQFLSSFSKETLINRLIKDNPKHLRVWSPYYAENISELIKSTLNGIKEIELVPAKTETQKIRITELEYKSCLDLGNIKFLQDLLEKENAEAFVHAKVWLTNSKIAIGSWNMTHAGMNLSKQGNNNIEAGVIVNITNQQYKHIISIHKTQELFNHDFCSAEELDKEKSEILDDFKTSVELVLDWDKQLIKLEQPTLRVLIKEIGADSKINLAGLGSLDISVFETPISIQGHQNNLSRDRFFEITDKAQKSLFKGYLREVGLAYRPVMSFENIDDYLKGWVNESPEDKSEYHNLAYNSIEKNLLAQTKTILESSGQNTWFSSFQAFESIINRLKKTMELPKPQRVVELKKIGRALPGSLNELKNHLLELKKLYTINPEKFKKSPLYLWFLIERANSIFSFYNQLINSNSEYIEVIPNLDFKKCFTYGKLTTSQNMGISKWKKLIEEQLKEV